MRRYFFIIAVLALLTYTVLWYAFQSGTLSNELKVYLLDIGQGDAMYIRAGDGSDMLIDGGPKGSLVQPLEAVLPFGDKEINVLVVTNPDADHYAGFIDLLKEYTVDLVIEPGTQSKTKTYAEFESLVAEKKIPKLIARKGMRILLDQTNGVEYDVLFPDRDVSSFTTNDGSIIAKLLYGTRSFIFTGDATAYTESLVLANSQSELLKSDVLKIGHHGSRTSTTNNFLEAVAPTYALISAGVHNKYGHPHPEVISRLKKFGVQILGTYESGTILCTTDGTALSCN
jgi:competence protein ComEC